MSFMAICHLVDITTNMSNAATVLPQLIKMRPTISTTYWTVRVW
jgi:hypothetical protein